MRQPASLVVLFGLALTVGLACERDLFKQAQQLGGEEVSAAVLNRGRLTYRRYCVGCHGVHGDGQGPTASSMVPPPRDFTSGLFKFSAVPGDKLPQDADLLRTLRHGLRGTHMPAFGSLPDDDARAVVQYLKTFSPRWRRERPGRPVPVPPDPFVAGRRGEAIRRGEAVYHGAARCWSCHPAYVGRSRLQELVESEAKRLGTKSGPLALRSDLARSVPQTCKLGKLLPPDFLADTVRAGQEQSELYRTVAAGVGGTPMIAWSSKLVPEDLWAVVHYVSELIRIKGTPEAAAMRQRAVD